MKNKRKDLIVCFIKFPMRVATPEGVRNLPCLGGPGGPKFSKNWLTFAHSSYDPDHKLLPRGPVLPGAP